MLAEYLRRRVIASRSRERSVAGSDRSNLFTFHFTISFPLLANI
jgi:hypothetical protein